VKQQHQHHKYLPGKKKVRSEMILITSGCSFSMTSQNIPGPEKHRLSWPDYLNDSIKGSKLISKAMGSQGNGLISKSIIYEVSKQLKECSADDLLVGIMWSGTDRHEILFQGPPLEPKADSTVENPTGFIKNEKNWQILNPWWENGKSSVYYKHIHSPLAGNIRTLEHILRTQWFLDKYKVKYFMTTFKDLHIASETETNYLKDLIDWSKFLPIPGMYEWCIEQTHKYYYAGLDESNHPTSESYEKFVKEVILPFGILGH